MSKQYHSPRPSWFPTCCLGARWWRSAGACTFAPVSLSACENQLLRCYRATATELSRSAAAPTGSRAGPQGHLSPRNSTAWVFGHSAFGKYIRGMFPPLAPRRPVQHGMLAAGGGVWEGKQNVLPCGAPSAPNTPAPGPPTESASPCGLTLAPGQGSNYTTVMATPNVYRSIRIACLSGCRKPCQVWWLLCARTAAVGWQMQVMSRQTRGADLDLAFTPVAEMQSSRCFGAAASLMKTPPVSQQKWICPSGPTAPWRGKFRNLPEVQTDISSSNKTYVNVLKDHFKISVLPLSWLPPSAF